MDMTPHFPIYLDYGATNPCDERVVEAMIPWLREHFGNPASRSHAWGWEAEEAVEKARVHVADLIGADPREIVWTSGATESNNLAIKGAAQFYKTKGKHLITVKTEHKAVLDTMRELERQGFEVTYLDVQEDGLLDLNKLKDAIRPDTSLISVMHVNNEIGVIQDIVTIGNMCRERGIIFHVDAAQSTGKVEIDMTKLPTTNSIGGFGCAVCASLFQTVVVALHFAYPPKDEPTAQASSLGTAAATEERRAESV
jgi:cysteine desulfurase